MLLFASFRYFCRGLILSVKFYTVTEETCDEVESLVFDLFANLGATGAKMELSDHYA